MISQDWEQVKELFETALQQSAGERRVFLAKLERDNSSIAKEVARLLTSYETAGDFLNKPWLLFPDLLGELDSEHRFAIGQVLCDRFQIIRLIGKGGMGEVYEAWDKELECSVALKTLRTEVSTHEEFTSRFRREIQLARKVTHPNVCRIFDSFKHALGDGTYLSLVSMELLNGETLAQHLQAKGHLSTSDALPIATQLVEGLNAVHAAGIIHRDLKPSNLILVRTESGYQLKITDFGIAGQLAPDSSTKNSNASRLLGTPDYMAPEQFEGGRASRQSDIYSVGLILYEMVTGNKPFPPGSAWKRISEDPQPPGKSIRNLPENWNKAILCCLEREPQYRFSNVLAVSEHLQSEVRPSPIPAKPFRTRIKAAAKRMLWRAALAGVSIVLSFLTLIYFRQSAQIPPGTRVLVVNIATTSDKALSGMIVAFKDQLQQSVHFDVVSDNEIADALRQMGRKPTELIDVRTARQVALRNAVPLAIYASITLTQEGYFFSVKLERVRFNPFFPAATWKKDFYAKTEAELLRDAVHDASVWVRKMAGESSAELGAQDHPVEDISTDSWEALQHFTEAEQKIASGDSNAAIVMLKQAIQEDPEFAKAHMRLADILVSKKIFKEGFDEWQKAVQLIDKRQLTSREALRIEGQYYEDTGDLGKADAKYNEYVIAYPNDYLAWFYWGSIQDALGKEDDAITSFSKSISLRPDAPEPHAHLAMILLSRKQYHEADDEISIAARNGREDDVVWLRANAAFLQQNFGLAFGYLDALSASQSDESKSLATLTRARFLAEMGKYEDAIKTLSAGIEFDRIHELPGKAHKLVSLAYLQYRNHNFEACRTAALDAASSDKAPGTIMQAGALLARIGDVAAARYLLLGLNQQPDITRTRLAKVRIKNEIDWSQHVSQRGFHAGSLATQAELSQKAHKFFTDTLSPVGWTEDLKPLLAEIVANHVKVLMFPQNDWPGLWGDSLHDYLATARPEQRLNLCQNFSEYIALRSNADLEIKAREVAPVQESFRTACH